MNDKELIKRVRMLKAMGYIKNYYELAEEIGIAEKSLYNWLGGYYSLGYGNKQRLNDLLIRMGV